MPEPRKLYRIGEVSRITAVRPFVLRYWETEFPKLRPVKSEKGQRLYREQDVAAILEIKRLLYEEGFTIAGARKHLKENGAAGLESGSSHSAARERVGEGSAKPLLRAKAQKVLREAREELRAILRLLDEE